MQFTDTHCHIHEADYSGGGEAALVRARMAGVEKLICVGTDERTSTEAATFAREHENVWASVGLHPHDATNGVKAVAELRHLLEENQEKPSKIIAIGECGLDYFYNHSPKEAQFTMLHAQLELAQEYNLPVIFHVRDAFDDFWPLLDEHPGLRGVLHSFTDSQKNMEEALRRGLFIGVNGISTFTKVEAQKEMFAAIPLERIILETDAPFLTPAPKRGTVNEPAFVTFVANFLANLRSISLEELSRATNQNASQLFLI